jgi:hypothetical protein
MKIYTLTEKQVEEFFSAGGYYRNHPDDLRNLIDSFYEYCLKHAEVKDE